MTIEKEAVMVDMDDVIVRGGFLALLNEFLHTNYRYEDFTSFYMQEVVPKEKQEDFFDFVFEKNMYSYGELLPHVREVIEELDSIYDFYVVTSYIFPEVKEKSIQLIPQKFAFLQQNLPSLSPERYYFCYNKSLLNFPIKIDDNYHNLDGADLKILFSAYHNRSMEESTLKKDGVVRADDWLEVK